MQKPGAFRRGRSSSADTIRRAPRCLPEPHAGPPPFLSMNWSRAARAGCRSSSSILAPYQSTPLRRRSGELSQVIAFGVRPLRRSLSIGRRHGRDGLHSQRSLRDHEEQHGDQYSDDQLLPKRAYQDISCRHRSASIATCNLASRK